jgi:hypothetical protein
MRLGRFERVARLERLGRLEHLAWLEQLVQLVQSVDVVVLELKHEEPGQLAPLAQPGPLEQSEQTVQL